MRRLTLSLLLLLVMSPLLITCGTTSPAAQLIGQWRVNDASPTDIGTMKFYPVGDNGFGALITDVGATRYKVDSDILTIAYAATTHVDEFRFTVQGNQLTLVPIHGGKTLILTRE